MTRDAKTNGPRRRRGRPFPLRCLQCLKEEIYPATVPYAADIRHDGQLYHIEVPKLRVPQCRACGALVFNYSADDQVLNALRSHLRLLTPQQIKEGRKKLGLQGKELAQRLGVAKETISRWETGMMIQSRAMDNFLRAYFAVPELRAVLLGPNQDASLGATAVVRRETRSAETHEKNTAEQKFGRKRRTIIVD
jgi:putative zinc finger/helix-turn-helix YgiT family protein